MGGGETGKAVGAGGVVLVGHELDGAREVGLDEFVASFRHLPARQVDRRIGLPAAILVGVGCDRPGKQRIHREALGGEADGGGGDVGETHRAVAAERCDPGVGGGGDDGAQDAVGDFAAVLAHEQVGGQALGPPAQAGDAFHRAVGEAEHDRGHAGEVDQVGLQHAECDARRTAGIDRVAAGLQDGEAGGGGEVVAG